MSRRPHFSDIEVRHTKKRGRGVFSIAIFRPGETIEICPVIVLKDEDIQNDLARFAFWWPGRPPGAAIALGYGSLYNHSANPNAHFRIAKKAKEIHIIAKTPIEHGQEIFIDYQYPDGYDFKVK